MTDDGITDELREKAKVIAEATGRSEEKIIEDLLDDGVVNLSNEEKKDASLVEQLKEAAELIATVQSINQQVSDNTVLNGGNNKTEVAVETTLEGDIVDRAIASVERKAQNIRKIVVIIAPIVLLLSGGVGLDFFLDNEDGGGSSWEDDEYYEIWGCTAPDAENFNPDATDDDGTCYWDTTGPPCNSDWRWDAVTIQDFDANGEGFNNDLQILMTFNDWNKCNRHMEGYFAVEIWDETRGVMWNQYQITNKFHDQYTIDDHHYDLAAGDYVVSVEYHFDDSHWTGPSALVTMESPDEDCNTDIVVNELVLTANGNDLNLYVEYQDNGDCNDPTPIQMQLALYKNDGYQDYFIANNNYFVANVGQTYFNINQDDNELMGDVEDGDWNIEFRWWIEGEEENCCEMTNTEVVDEIPDYVPCEAVIDNLQATVSETDVTVMFYIAQTEGTDCNDPWDIEINLIPVDDNEEEDITHENSISETSNYYAYTFNDVPNGDWQPEVIIFQNEEDIAEESHAWVYVNYQEPQEVCEINLFDWNFNITENHEAFFFYDLDCGYNTNDLEGYNVSTQFIVYPAGEIAQEEVIKYVTGLQYIQGYTDDTRFLKLDNFTDEEITHYDFYWYAVWIDGNGTQQFIERTALNQEIITESEEEPVECSNLTLTSNSLVLGKDADDNLTLSWDINHDGPADESCSVSIEIQITLYQNGSYYDISDFQENGVHLVYANGTISLDADDVELFGDLPTGTYEVLVKYRIGTDVSSDHFANSVSIS